MINIGLPSNDPDALAYVQSTMDKKYHVYIVYDKITDASTGVITYFTRLSAQVYVQLSDFERVAELVPLLLHEYYSNLSESV